MSLWQLGMAPTVVIEGDVTSAKVCEFLQFTVHGVQAVNNSLQVMEPCYAWECGCMGVRDYYGKLAKC
jgi:hypothetical protein